MKRKSFLVPNVTDWVTFTPTGTWSANTTYTGRWRRFGDSIEVQVRAATSGIPVGTFTVNIPNGGVIDTAKIADTTAQSFGVAYGVDASTANYAGLVFYNTTTAVGVVGVGIGAWAAAVPFNWNTGDYLSIIFTVPIVGWKANRRVF